MDKVNELMKEWNKNVVLKRQRFGQGLFNAVFDIDPEISKEIRATDKDCYYDNLNCAVVVKMFIDKHAKEIS